MVAWEKMLGTRLHAMEILNPLSRQRKLTLVDASRSPDESFPSLRKGCRPQALGTRAWIGGLWGDPSLAGDSACFALSVCPSIPGLVPEPADERQEAAPGHDLAPPGGSCFLYLHDEPRGGHRQLALPLPLPPAPALLFPCGSWSRFGFGCSCPLQFPVEAAGHLSRPVPPLPATRTAVRFPTPLSICRSDPRAERRRREPLLLFGLSREPGSRASPAAFGIGL